MVAPNTSTKRDAKSHVTCRTLEDGTLAFDFEAACGSVYKNIMEILMEWFNKIPKTSPDCECVYNWSKEQQKLWFLGAENMEKDVVLWETLLQSIKENDE